MIAYKVLYRKPDNTLISCGVIPGNMKFTYSQDKENFPLIEYSKFFVFKTLINAIKFKNSILNDYPFGSIEIWECETPYLDEVFKLPSIWWSLLSFKEIKKYWESPNSLDEDYLRDCSEGCCKTNSIKLIKKYDCI